MSDEKRFTNKKLIAVSIMLVLFIGATGVLGFMSISVSNNYTNLSGDYDSLYIDHLELLIDFNNLDNQYFILTGEHIELENDYNALVIALADMIIERDNLIIALNTMTTERDDLLIQIDILNVEISIHLTTISGLESQIDDLEAEIIVLEGQAIVDLETISDLNAQIVVLNAEITNHLSIISGLEDDITVHLLTISGLEAELIEMTGFRDDLQVDLDALQLQYDILFGDYQILFDANADLLITYDALLIAYDYMCDTIRQSILPVQYSIFAEAVRRHYVNVFNEDWYSFAEFCRDIVLHDSGQYNAFSEVSNAFSNALIWGNDTMLLADFIMYWTFYPWLPNWDGFALTGNELTDIDTIVDWCIDEIDYEFDSDIIVGQEYFDGDYIKFPVETAFRTLGDCEDQAILTAAYLESCGFETAIGIFHDENNPEFSGGFFHGVCFVKIDDTDAFKLMFPNWVLWRFSHEPVGEYSWCLIDTTWDVSFGSIPPWFDYYWDNPGELTLDTLTRVICDIDGVIEADIGENIDITCVMST